MKHLDRSFLYLAGLVILLAGYFSITGGLDLVSAGEARAAQIAREMVERQNFILPSLNHEVSRETLTKPPLFHWSLILTASVAGWSNTAMHLPSALAATGSVLLVYVLGAAMFGRRAGLYSALVLSSTLLFLTNANAARIDIFFTFLMLAAVTAFYCAQQDPGRRRLILLFYVCAALAVISKGPAGMILPLVIAIVFLWWRGQLSMLRELYPGAGTALFLLLAVPWYVGVALTAPPELVQHFFFGQLSHWWAGSGSAAGKAGKAAWYYLPYLFVGMFPWSVFLPLALIYALRDSLRQRQHAVALLVIWFLGGLVVFSLGGKKAARYLLPMLPAGAILLGYYWDRISGAVSRTQRTVQVIFAIFMVLALAGLIAWLMWGFRNPAAMEQMLLEGRNAGDTIKLRVGWEYLLAHSGAVLTLLGLMMLAGSTALIGYARRQLVTGTLATAMVAWLGLFSYSAWFEPVKVGMMSPSPAAAEVARMVPADARIYIGGNAYKHAFSWYLQRDLQRLRFEELQQRLNGPAEGWLVFMTKKPLTGPESGRYQLVKQWQVDYYTISLFRPLPAG